MGFDELAANRQHQKDRVFRHRTVYAATQGPHWNACFPAGVQVYVAHVDTKFLHKLQTGGGGEVASTDAETLANHGVSVRQRHRMASSSPTITIRDG